MTRNKKSDVIVSPYPGLPPFEDTPEHRKIYFGRDKEKEKLLNKVRSERLTLLFSRSGLGKSSLLNAGVAEELRGMNMFPIICRLTYSPEGGPIVSVINCIKEQAQKHNVVIEGDTDVNSLWAFFSNATFKRSNEELSPILILDQFEELFTVIRENKKFGKQWEEEFTRQLSDVVRCRLPKDVKEQYQKRLEVLKDIESEERQDIIAQLYKGEAPDVSTLIAIREDYMAELESFYGNIPNIFRNTMRLTPMTADQARDAIVKPGRVQELLGDDTFTYEDAAVDEMISYLSNKGKNPSYTEEVIEPTHLQILCDYLNKRRMKKTSNRNIITTTDLKGRRGMKMILHNFYVDILQNFPRIRMGWSARRWRLSPRNFILFYRAKAGIKRLFEKGMITPTGFRNSISSDEIQYKYGVQNKDLQLLTRMRLIREDRRLGNVFYELSHDCLIEPIQYGKKRFRPAYIALFAFIFVLPFMASVVDMFGDYYTFSTNESLLTESHTTQERQASIDNLLGINLRESRLYDSLDLSSKNLDSLNLNSKLLVEANFNTSNLTRANLRGAYLLSADFREARLEGADLSLANLTSANFTKANLSEAKLSGANLEEAILVNAILNDANLSSTNLKRADFSGVDINSSTNLTNSNWWLALGWTDEQISEFKRYYPLLTYAESQEYDTWIRDLEQRISSAEDPLNRVLALNDVAWFRVTNSDELLEAQSSILEAIDILEETKAPELTVFEFHIYDTYGYILLRLNQPKEAIKYFTKSLQAFDRDRNKPRFQSFTSFDSKNLEEGMLPASGELHYHIALAYQLADESRAAGRHFSIAETYQYEPSYEKVITPKITR